MSFQQIGAFYVLMFGGAGATDGDCDPLRWTGPSSANINLSEQINWVAPVAASINLCGPLEG